jgi:hypothetical protein
MEESHIARKEILDMGLDDITGLYEILWRFNTLWPDMDVGKKYQLADETLRELLNRNAVRIINQTLDNDQRHYEAIDQNGIDEILRSPVSWYPSVSDDPWSHFSYETTDIGEALYSDLYRRTGS